MGGESGVSGGRVCGMVTEEGRMMGWDPVHKIRIAGMGMRVQILIIKKMIEANPSNSLLLANYVKFLKGDFAKAEEYCGMAILADPKPTDGFAGDGSVSQDLVVVEDANLCKQWGCGGALDVVVGCGSSDASI
ncbi:unnamed protein product [Fraxinus pennsylvanica]|uniref:Uncharacterized protein n=1 Tax=Fraxinus pennsylvanica TaxID=56036 RepID=A0AAD2A899_9LAMI|nr:unnamed protein product [Fraxinus pennsylvanica]